MSREVRRRSFSKKGKRTPSRSLDVRADQPYDEARRGARLVRVGLPAKVRRREVLGAVEGQLAIAAEAARRGRQPIDLAGGKITLPWIGVGYQFGGVISGLKIYTKFPF